MNLHTCNPFPFNGSAQAIFFRFSLVCACVCECTEFTCFFSYVQHACSSSSVPFSFCCILALSVYVTIFSFILLGYTARPTIIFVCIEMNVCVFVFCCFELNAVDVVGMVLFSVSLVDFKKILRVVKCAAS